MNVAITINGKKRFVRDRITVFEACREAGVYIPHFCYHPKLSVVANCRMCLVQVEKAPKPMPACATYVTDGMVVNTNSPKAQAAQKSVMEFLLINHPLDCPICDQGGECQLQDLAVGYGASCSRYGETKRVVVEKQLGPLISTVMTRCIHCTRCVRFGEEVAGIQELGMVGRGEHAEIMPFITSTVDSEISGNMIDVCPVGALNSKPFRFSARTWELHRADGIAQHDSWGSMIHIQVFDDVVKRVLPRDHEEINECWLSDRDRFAYTGLSVPTRLTHPYVREPGSVKPRLVEWPEALEEAHRLLRATLDTHGPEQIGVLLGPSTISEVGLLAGEFSRSLGSSNIDHRLHQQDFSLDEHERGTPWLGCSIEKLADLKNILLVGANPARELPLLAVRLRRLSTRGKTAVSVLGARDLQGQFKVTNQLITAPSTWVRNLGLICQAVAGKRKLPAWIRKLGKPEAQHRKLAASLQDGSAAVFLGAEAIHAQDYGALRIIACELARLLDGFHGVLPEGGNAVGNHLAGAVPHHGMMDAKVERMGLNARQMIEKRLKAYILIGCEPLDFADPQAAASAFKDAATIHIGGFADVARDYADVMVPAAVFAERTGATVNLEGNAATMWAAVPLPGEAKPAWKVLRMLGSMLGLTGYDYHDLDEVRASLIKAGDFARLLANDLPADLVPSLEDGSVAAANGAPQTFERIPEMAHFSSDQIVRRAAPLQATRIAERSRQALFHPDDLATLGLQPGATVALTTTTATVECPAGVDTALARGCVRCPWGVDEFMPLGCAATVTAAAVAHQPQVATGTG